MIKLTAIIGTLLLSLTAAAGPIEITCLEVGSNHKSRTIILNQTGEGDLKYSSSVKFDLLVLERSRQGESLRVLTRKPGMLSSSDDGIVFSSTDRSLFFFLDFYDESSGSLVINNRSSGRFACLVP